MSAIHKMFSIIFKQPEEKKELILSKKVLKCKIEYDQLLEFCFNQKSQETKCEETKQKYLKCIGAQ